MSNFKIATAISATTTSFFRPCVKAERIKTFDADISSKYDRRKVWSENVLLPTFCKVASGKIE
jgi:hypothetical protein